MRRLTCFALLLAGFEMIAAASGIIIDGVLDEDAYSKAIPLNSDISTLYLVPTPDMLYIGAEVEDKNITIPNPQEFWDASCVEIWFDWGNDDSAAFDENDQQFWFCPIEGNGLQGYAGQWHRAQDNIEATVYDYANQSEWIEMAFVIDDGVGYTIEVAMAPEAVTGYTPDATIGFTYSADVLGSKHEWEEAGIGGNFYEQPNTWPDLTISAVDLPVQPKAKLAVRWADLRR